MIKTLIANLEEQLNRMENRMEHLNNKMEQIFEVNNLVNQHHHDLYGNGKKGLIRRLEELENKINNYSKLYIYIMAVITIITFLPKIREFLILIR